ncbi:hypothetical protein H6P81_020177 [Aristolochia fimbriata]|uniref:Uncharacterized protein n=1 Tax=Aristolochia fimbriata TaxID=158543 RepID=A0AAV7DWY9_ARIFI|nr:hypothetical protein H6P81_020177 [Aristolochia fimbriata]
MDKKEGKNTLLLPDPPDSSADSSKQSQTRIAMKKRLKLRPILPKLCYPQTTSRIPVALCSSLPVPYSFLSVHLFFFFFFFSATPLVLEFLYWLQAVALYNVSRSKCGKDFLLLSI